MIVSLSVCVCVCVCVCVLVIVSVFVCVSVCECVSVCVRDAKERECTGRRMWCVLTFVGLTEVDTLGETEWVECYYQKLFLLFVRGYHYTHFPLL